MSSISSICNYFCAGVAFVAIFFFGFLAWQEKVGNEYLLREFNKDGDVEGRVQNLTIVIGINAVLFITFLTMICRQPTVEDDKPTPEWKFAYKIERPKQSV